MNPDPKHNRCDCTEEIPQIPVGEFHKETKTAEQKKLELEDKMEKMQKELNKVSVSCWGDCVVVVVDRFRFPGLTAASPVFLKCFFHVPPLQTQTLSIPPQQN